MDSPACALNAASPHAHTISARSNTRPQNAQHSSHGRASAARALLPSDETEGIAVSLLEPAGSHPKCSERGGGLFFSLALVVARRRTPLVSVSRAFPSALSPAAGGRSSSAPSPVGGDSPTSSRFITTHKFFTLAGQSAADGVENRPLGRQRRPPPASAVAIRPLGGRAVHAHRIRTSRCRCG